MNRIKSREAAVRLLFEKTITGEKFEEFMENISNIKDETGFYIEEKDNEGLELEKLDMNYIEDILKGIEENQKELDETIEKHLKNWKLYRLSKMDLSILRLATYEIKKKEVPDVVAINEAVELGKKYSTEKSASFINGVLDNIIK